MPLLDTTALEDSETSVWLACFEGTDGLSIWRAGNAARWQVEVDGVWSTYVGTSRVVKLRALGGPRPRDVWPVGGEGAPAPPCRRWRGWPGARVEAGDAEMGDWGGRQGRLQQAPRLPN